MSWHTITIYSETLETELDMEIEVIEHVENGQNAIQVYDGVGYTHGDPDLQDGQRISYDALCEEDKEAVLDAIQQQRYLRTWSNKS